MKSIGKVLSTEKVRLAQGRSGLGSRFQVLRRCEALRYLRNYQSPARCCELALLLLAIGFGERPPP
jgi:hypothetical protein